MSNTEGSKSVEMANERLDGPQHEHVPLTASEKQGANQVLRLIQRYRLEVADAYRNATFDRQKGITSGMLKAYDAAYFGVLSQFPELLSSDIEPDTANPPVMKNERSPSTELPTQTPQQRHLPFE